MADETEVRYILLLDVRKQVFAAVVAEPESEKG